MDYTIANARHENWLEEVNILLNSRNWKQGTKQEIVEKLIVVTKFNRFQLQKAYRIMFEKDKMKEFFDKNTYFKEQVDSRPVTNI